MEAATWEAALQLSRQELKVALPRQGAELDDTRGGASALGDSADVSRVAVS